jgi:hypothetical protein
LHIFSKDHINHRKNDNGIWIPINLIEKFKDIFST